MPSNTERRVPRKERGNQKPQRSFDWEAARVFLEIARQGSFRAAAGSLHQSVNTLRRRLDALEGELGVTLLTRHVDGVRMTSEGERALAALRRMESAAFDIARSSHKGEDAMRGEVKLAVTEGLGTFWITPMLLGFQQAHPGIAINLISTMSSPDILRREADISVQLIRPLAKELMIAKVGRLHTMAFAAKSYVERYGSPVTAAELVNHRLSWLVADQVTFGEEFFGKFQGASEGRGIVMRTNTSSAHYMAVVSGLGIGMLPTYVCAFGEPLVPIDIDYGTAHDIWLVYHTDANRTPRVRKLISWLVDGFSPKKFPWFSDRFVHPRDLPGNVYGLSAARPFKHKPRTGARK